MCTDGPCKPDARSTCIPYPFASSSLQSWGHEIDARCWLGLSISPDSVSEVYSSQHKTDCDQLGHVKNQPTFHLSLSPTTPISCSTQHLPGPWQPKAAICLASCSDVIDVIETDCAVSTSSPSAPRPPSFFSRPYDIKTDTSTPGPRLNPPRRCSATTPRTPSSAAHSHIAKRRRPWRTGRRRISQPCTC